MSAQTRLDRILSRLTPEHFAEKVLPGVVSPRLPEAISGIFQGFSDQSRSRGA